MYAISRLSDQTGEHLFKKVKNLRDSIILICQHLGVKPPKKLKVIIATGLTSSHSEQRS
jgi:ketopantoate hydroxymethyltransferase